MQKNRDIRALSLSNNSQITYKTAEFIAECLKSHAKTYPILHLEFAGCDLGELGIRQLCELLEQNDSIKLIDFGKVEDKGLKLLGDYASKFIAIETIQFQESEKGKWSKDSMNNFIQGLKNSDVILDVKVELIDNASWKSDTKTQDKIQNEKFVKEIQFYAEINRKKLESKKHIEEWSNAQIVDKQFECIM